MRKELCALDLETSGLDIQNDAIIEIGLVRLSGGLIVDEYATLINPGFQISAETTHITGIQQDDLRKAPLLPQILPTITAFAGNAPIIAHNVKFDLGFMRRFGCLKQNQAIDTLEIASILLPKAPRYGLSALTEMLEIQLENAHRALADARATALLYWKLYEIACALPKNLLQEIHRTGRELNWELADFFEQAHQEAADRPIRFQWLSQPVPAPAPDRHIAESPRSIEAEKLANRLSEDGPLAKILPNYESRPQQIAMTEEIAQAFNAGEHLLVEAGTGIGKSLAYLTVAAEWAIQNRERVVIATYTTHLQEQLQQNDGPIVSELCSEPLAIAVLKGRANYLCPRRLEALRRRRPANLDELRVLSKIMIWLDQGGSGDRNELTLRGPENNTWNRLSAQDEGCTTVRCSASMQGVCPYYRARRKAEAAQVLIVNHALLVSDAMREHRVLPDYQMLIIDEAHQLEEAITNGLSQRVDAVSITGRIQDLGNLQTGTLGEMLRSTRDKIPGKMYARMEAYVQSIAEVLEAMKSAVRAYFGAVRDYYGESNRSGEGGSIRIDAIKRQQSSFQGIIHHWDRLSEYLEGVSDALQRLNSGLGRVESNGIAGLEDLQHSLGSAAEFFAETLQVLKAFSIEPDANQIYWISAAQQSDYTAVQSAPLHVGAIAAQELWNSKRSIVLTSATLQSNDGFHYLRDRLHAEHVREVVLGSPFDYRTSALVYIPNDIPEPKANTKVTYQRAVERAIIELATVLNGRVMVLFTSYAQLRETASAIAPRLALGDIRLYDQVTGGSRESLVDGFRSTERAVLLGTRSFWQGVDIPGDDLSALVITRLPFAVPSEPVFAARSETYQDSFGDFAVPDAVLRFRQGFGRLIRTRTDRGIVAVLDSRIIGKGYGSAFLDSLPDCEVRIGPLEGLAHTAESWLVKPIGNQE